MYEREAEKKAEMLEHNREANGGTVGNFDLRASSVPAWGEQSGDDGTTLMDEVLQHKNLAAAYRRVVRNDGAPGVDGMTADDMGKLPREHFARIWEELRNDRYQPQAVLRVEIPKSDGKGVRLLGIPTVMDRLIQQAVLQRLQPIFEPTFSDGSFGFRPGRNTHQAVLRAREYVASGYGYVVDLDLEKFFDRVNHDVLMARIARRIKDKRILRLIRRYLQAGVLEGGLVSPRSEGTPQGGPLSPLLSNILLDDLDKELERRGHKFVRYADDCNVYVQSETAGLRVMESLGRFLEKRLRLKINREKSAVARPEDRKFLGFSVTARRKRKIRIADQSLRRLKEKLRPILRRGRGHNIRSVIRELNPIIRGWVGYFRLAEVKGVFGQLDEWVRRKLRCIVWRQWQSRHTRFRELKRLGVDAERAAHGAFNGRGPWWNARQPVMHQAISTKYLQMLGLAGFREEYQRLTRAS